MTRLSSLFAVLLGVLVMGAGPDTFSRAELEAREEEKSAAERQLAALEAAETTAEIDASKLSEALISAAMESRRREEQASDAERKLIDLDVRRSAAMQSLFADEDALEDLLAALASSARSRPPALIVSPERANASVRAAILMGDAAPALAERATALADEIAELNQLERFTRRERARLEAAEAKLNLKQAEIELLAAAKRAQYEDVAGDVARLRSRASELGGQAETLRDLLAALEAGAPDLPGRKPQYAALNNSNTVTDVAPSVLSEAGLANLRPLGAREIGAMLRPVGGPVSEAYNKRRTTGSRSEGITFVTRQQAQVVSPVDGVIEWADEFRSYGHMLILRTSDDYRVILSGLADIYGTVGQGVAAGEPVGRMSARKTPPPELYLELRKNDRTENPSGWMVRETR